MENPPEMCNTGEHAIQMSEHTRNKNDPPLSQKYIHLGHLQTWVPPPPPRGLENRYFPLHPRRFSGHQKGGPRGNRYPTVSKLPGGT